MSDVRCAAVAGSWYPDDPVRLTAQLRAYLAGAEHGPLPSLRALIAPHAGLIYSGSVAAHAYRLASGRAFDAVVLVGPSHFVPFAGVALWGRGSWETPLGSMRVDEALARSIRDASSLVVDLPAAHAREHSLEMQLPFLALLFPGVPIVPMVMGRQTRATAFALGEALALAIGSRNALLVASSDLSHYEDAVIAAQLDAVVLDRVEALDAEGLMRALEVEPRHACGGGPMVSVLDAARRLGCTSSRVLRYADSSDVSGDKSSVVGYMAAAIG